MPVQTMLSMNMLKAHTSSLIDASIDNGVNASVSFTEDDGQMSVRSRQDSGNDGNGSEELGFGSNAATNSKRNNKDSFKIQNMDTNKNNKVSITYGPSPSGTNAPGMGVNAEVNYGQSQQYANSDDIPDASNSGALGGQTEQVMSVSADVCRISLILLSVTFRT